MRGDWGVLRDAAASGFGGTLRRTDSSVTKVSFEFGRLQSVESTASLNSTLQVIKDGRLGVSSSSKPGSDADLLAKAADLAEFGPEVPYDVPAPAPPAAELRSYDPELAELSLEELIGRGEGLVTATRSLHPELQVMCVIERSVSHPAIANTKGLAADWRRSTLSVILGVELIEGRDMLQVWSWEVGTAAGLDLDGVQRRVAEDFAAARRIVPVAPGGYPVLFRPNAFVHLISRLTACLDGGAVVRKVSPFAGKLGERLFSPQLTLVEDGLLAGGPGSRLYDDQGVACRRTVLIERGRLREYLLDLDSAARLGREPIGTGGIERARPNNLLVAPGETSHGDLLAGIKRGLVIDETIGAWAGNPYTGQVSGNIGLGFLVEDGKIVGRVKDCMFSLNALTDLGENLVGLSRETRCMGGQMLPWALIDDVTIATRS